VKHEHALSLATVAAGPPVNISGRWTNELTSWVDFRQDANGVLSGHYRSAVSIGGGPVDSDDVTGYVQGTLVSFVVRWPNASITAWVGQHIVDRRTGAESIDTLWQMTMLNSDGQGGYWHSIMAGSDIFGR
jgi:hypothetical protein